MYKVFINAKLKLKLKYFVQKVDSSDDSQYYTVNRKLISNIALFIWLTIAFLIYWISPDTYGSLLSFLLIVISVVLVDVLVTLFFPIKRHKNTVD